MTLRNRTLYRLEEAVRDFRNEGKLPSMDFDQRPLCLVRSKDFPQFEDAQQATIQMKINETNQCEYPTEWKQGFSPKEHAEMDMFDRQ